MLLKSRHETRITDKETIRYDSVCAFILFRTFTDDFDYNLRFLILDARGARARARARGRGGPYPYEYSYEWRRVYWAAGNMNPWSTHTRTVRLHLPRTSTSTFHSTSTVRVQYTSLFTNAFVLSRASRSWLLFRLSRFRGLPQDAAVPSRCRRRESPEKIQI